MKKKRLIIYRIFFLSGLIFMMGYSSSHEKQLTESFDYKPVLMTRENLEKSIELQGPKKLSKTGKIYIKGHYIYISERYKGIHVIDNEHPESPVIKSFIRVPGCMDMAVKGNTLYVDNAVDLVALDISDNEKINVISRIKEVFPEIPPPDNLYVPHQFNADVRPENTVIVDWIKADEELQP